MEREVLEKADRLIANTPVMKKNFVALHPDLDLERRMRVIPNGFDHEDFGQARVHNSERRFTVTYTGSLYLRRTPDNFLEAAGHLVRSGRIPKESFCIRFIGNIKEKPINLSISRNGLEGVVEILPYMEHRDCIYSMLKSHVLLLLEGGKGSECFYTGKLFEYIRTERPILALVPDQGAAADLIRRTRTGMVCHWSDTAAIERSLAELYDRWVSGTLKLSPNREEIQKYDRRVLTEKLATILDGMAAGRPP